MRKLFGTDGVRGTANTYPITAEVALKLGKAAAMVLTNGKKKPLFLIGKDTRLSGYMLENSLTAGLTSMGANVLLVGPMPTPAIAHLVRSFAADAGIMISASHNPYEDNGIKFFDNRGHKLPDEIEEKIECLVLKDRMAVAKPKDIGRAHRIDDAQGRYIEYAKGTIDNLSLKGLKLVLDCANGAAYKVAPLILKELGAELIVLNAAPDGNNINKECGALHPQIARTAVLSHHADAGITLDGDADRIIMIDNKGKILDGDYLLAIAGLEMLKKGQLRQDTIIITHYTNLAFDALIKSRGGSTVRTKNGDRYVIEEMNTNGYNLGGEYTGHIIFSDHNPTGDGIIAALQILKVMVEQSKSLSKLASVLKKYPQVMLSIKVREKAPLSKLAKVQAALRHADKVLGEGGRHLVRYSGTEQLARVMVEGPDMKTIQGVAHSIAEAIKDEVGV